MDIVPWSSNAAASGVVNTDKLMLLQDPSGTPSNGTETLANLGIYQEDIQVMAESGTVSSGNGKNYWMVPARFNGWNLTDVACAVSTAPSGTPIQIMIHNLTDATDMMSLGTSIDASETSSYTAASAGVIDTDNDDVASGDILRFDVISAGTGAQNLMVNLTFSKN